MKNKNFWIVGWILLTSLLLLLICSRSSFLYPCNDWNDANSYFTMGKALMNGQVLYRDVYDQKGPYLYLLYGIAYLISHTTFIGVFLLEILSVSLFLCDSYFIMKLFVRKPIALFLLPLMGAVMFSSKSFYWGGAAEEFCLPMLGWSLFFGIKYFRQQTNTVPGMGMIFLNGLFAGVVMQVKYTLLGFYFAWMLMMLIAFIMKRDWKGILRGCLAFLGGMVLTMLPWLIYFGVNGAMTDWYQCYIYNNIFLYSNLAEGAGGIGSRIYVLAKLLLWLIIDNIGYFIFIGLGMIYFIVSFRIRIIEKVNLILLAGLLFIGIYFGGANLPYYAIPLMVFTVLGFIPIGILLQQAVTALCGKLTDRYRLICQVTIGVLVLVSSMVFCYTVSMNSSFMRQSQEEYFLYRFRNIISQQENPTLVTIGCLDAGLFTVADIVPSCRFFQTNGIAYDKLFREQERYVKEGTTQFILTRDTIPNDIDKLYVPVAQALYEWDQQQFTYYLFQKK